MFHYVLYSYVLLLLTNKSGHISIDTDELFIYIHMYHLYVSISLLCYTTPIAYYNHITNNSLSLVWMIVLSVHALETLTIIQSCLDNC